MPTLPIYEKEARWMHIRIHKEPKNELYKKFFDTHFLSHVCSYEEHSNRPHCHAICEINQLRSVEIKKLLKKQFNFFGNPDFAVHNIPPTEHDEQQELQYACKGDHGLHKPPFIVSSSEDFTLERILNLQKIYWQRHTPSDISSSAPSDLPKMPDRPAPKGNWTERIYDEILTELMSEDWNWQNEAQKIKVLSLILKKLGNLKKSFNEHKVREWLYGFYNYVDAANFRDAMITKVLRLVT